MLLHPQENQFIAVVILAVVLLTSVAVPSISLKFLPISSSDGFLHLPAGRAGLLMSSCHHGLPRTSGGIFFKSLYRMMGLMAVGFSP
jgi:hypothetical protein